MNSNNHTIKIPGALSQENEVIVDHADADDTISDDEPEIATDTKNGRRPFVNVAPDVLLEKAHRLLAKYTSSNENDKALHQLVRCTALSALVYGPSHWRYAETYTNLAQGYLDLKGNGYCLQAEQHCEFARNILLVATQDEVSGEEEKASQYKVVINTYGTLGRAQALLKKFVEAESNVHKAIQLVAEMSKLSCITDDVLEEMGCKLHALLAKISSRLEKHALAVNHYEKALEMAKRRYGEDNVELIPFYQGLGQVEQNKGKLADHHRSVEMYLQAHSIAAARSADGNSREVAESARALAAAYSRTGDDVAETSAESYLNESLSIYLTLHGPIHPTVCQIQDDLARLLLRTDRYSEAISLLQSTLKPKAELHNDYSEEVCETYKLIGHAHLSQQNLEAALSAFYKCYDIQEVLFGVNAKKTKETKKVLDTISAHPSLAGKQSGTEMNSRPRFQSVVGHTKSSAGGRTGVFN